MGQDSFDWTADAIERLKTLWAQDAPRLSTAEIGRQMGITKNQVVGKVRRLSLPPRENPILGGAGELQAARRRAAEAHPVGGAKAVRVARSVAAPTAAPAAAREASRYSRLAVRPLPAGGLPSAGPSPHKTCRWIEGEAAGAATRFCDAPTLRGRSWCAAHAARCFTDRPSWGHDLPRKAA